MEFYWEHIGKPWSEIRGLLADSTSLSLTNILLWILLILSAFRVFKMIKHRKLFRKDIAVMIFVLIFLIGTQAAGPIFMLPSSWRTRVHLQIDSPEAISAPGFFSMHQEAQDRFIENFDSVAYFKTDPLKILGEINRSIDSAIQKLGYTPGRQVNRVKNPQGLPKWIGFAYGGPAYHDPITAELAVPDSASYPATRIWRLHAVVHECVHAKGFMNELDTEVITWYALTLSRNKLLNWLADYLILRKSGRVYTLPHAVWVERHQSYQHWKRWKKEHYIIAKLRSLFVKTGIRNNSKKYGQNKAPGKAPVKNLFFRNISRLKDIEAPKYE